MGKSHPLAGSQPEEHYLPATRKRMHLDKTTSHGGWPEGEYDPPVRDRIYGWYKKMKMMPEGDEGDEAGEYVSERGNQMRITESTLRRIIREEFTRLREANEAAVSAVKSFRAKKFGSESEMQKAKKSLASELSSAGVKGETAITSALEAAGYGDGAMSFASELSKMQSMQEGQRGNDENGQHDNDTDPGDPYAKRLKEARRARLQNAVLNELRRRSNR